MQPAGGDVGQRATDLVSLGLPTVGPPSVGLGTVLRTGEDDWTRNATVTDPAGARFTMSQFAPPTEWD